jgi:SAM-dependent methyltransferase
METGRAARAARCFLAGKAHPGYCPICGLTVFHARGPWLRDEYLCERCQSIPRHRALICVLGKVAPDWPEQTIFESSPSGPASSLIAQRCRNYTPSQYFEGVASGIYVNKIRREDLRCLTLPDNSVDLVVTSDVFEHIVNPGAAFREIARVLRRGGLHVFTVPIFERPHTLVRVADDGTELMAPDYHGNPIGDGRSLVVREWGDDITDFIEAEAGTPTRRYRPHSWRLGIRGEMTDVLVSQKAPPT